MYLSFHDLKRDTCITFMMFFKILRSVILSIFLLFYLSLFFTITMMILLGIQHNIQGYRNVGHAIMTAFLGKLPYDYKPIFHGEIKLTAAEYAAGYMLMLLLFFSLSITAINLLIGQAMADVRLIQKTSESLIFQNQVDMIIEFNRIKKKFKLKNMCSCFYTCDECNQVPGENVVIFKEGQKPERPASVALPDKLVVQPAVAPVQPVKPVVQPAKPAPSTPATEASDGHTGFSADVQVDTSVL